jgi:hypothetical protein
MESEDLPQDLTFNDPAITGRPQNLPLSREPKPEPVLTPMQKLRDVAIGLFLVGAFFAALYAMSLLITGARGK